MQCNGSGPLATWSTQSRKYMMSRCPYYWLMLLFKVQKEQIEARRSWRCWPLREPAPPSPKGPSATLCDCNIIFVRGFFHFSKKINVWFISPSVIFCFACFWLKSHIFPPESNTNLNIAIMRWESGSKVWKKLPVFWLHTLIMTFLHRLRVEVIYIQIPAGTVHNCIAKHLTITHNAYREQTLTVILAFFRLSCATSAICNAWTSSHRHFGFSLFSCFLCAGRISNSCRSYHWT